MIDRTFPSLPAARLHDLVTTTAAEEVLVYDQRNHHIHHLNPTTSAVWQACDGRRTVPEMQVAVTATLGAPLSAELLRLALTQLEDADLLAGSLEPSLRLGGQTRRRFLTRAAVAGAVAVPALVSISSAAAGVPVSPQCGQNCTGLGDDFCASLPGPCTLCDDVGGIDLFCQAP